MKTLLRYFSVCLLAAFALTSLAGSIDATWVLPKTNTDGSSIPDTGEGSIASSRIEWGTCNGSAFGTKLGEKVIQGQATAASIPNLMPGTYCGRIYVTNTYGVESDPSNTASKIIPAPKPNPPTNFSVN